MISTKQRSASLATGRWDWVNTKLPDDYPMDYLAGRLELFTVSLPGFSWFGDWFVQRVSISKFFFAQTHVSLRVSTIKTMVCFFCPRFRVQDVL